MHVFLHFGTFGLMVLHLILASKLSELEQFEVFWDPTFFWLTLYIFVLYHFIMCCWLLYKQMRFKKLFSLPTLCSLFNAQKRHKTFLYFNFPNSIFHLFSKVFHFKLWKQFWKCFTLCCESVFGKIISNTLFSDNLYDHK